MFRRQRTAHPWYVTKNICSTFLENYNLCIYLVFQMPSFDASSVISTVASRSRKLNSIRNLSNTNKIAIPGIGTATQLSSGDIRVDYKDGTALTVSKIKNRNKFYTNCDNQI